MERKHTPSYSIKGKLVSAVCMLLVAVIMVVSSTYAWFTLSTAPEVSGISTAIGANGALEIKLAGTNAGGVRNTEFGNIIDLSTGYGLDKITLLPSKLGAITEAGLFSNAFLEYPTYGNDGRVGTTFGSTQLGLFDGVGAFKDDVNATGVRAVGAVSGLTARQAAYRRASTTANTAMSTAKSNATVSLNTNGSALGNIVVKKATNANAVYTQAELTSLETIVTDLETNVLPKIEGAYLAQIEAFAASALTDTKVADMAISGLTGDIVYNTVAADIADKEITLQSVATDKGISITYNETKHTMRIEGTALYNGIVAYNTTVANVASAKTAISDLKDGGDDMTWTDLSAVINYLIKADKVQVNGLSVEGLNVDTLAQKIIDDGMKIKVTMLSGAGVYADIADQCGDYAASIVLDTVQAGSVTANDIPAEMNTKSSVTTAYLTAASTQVTSAGEPVKGSTAGGTMTEIYGFILDLIFQTNAANSDLLLQTAPANRIYEDNDNADIMGHGSTMTFASSDLSEFSNDQVKALMDNIRIVFFAPGTTNKVLGYAKLDVNNSQLGSDGVTANMYMYDVVKTYTYTVGEATTTVYSIDGETFYSTVTYVDGKSGDGFMDVEISGAATIPDGVELTLKADAKDMFILKDDKSVITSLAQNEEVKISTLVYLDGTNLENADVAATQAQSMTGKMNIQFSSSADLKPMEYGELMKEEATTAATPTP